MSSQVFFNWNAYTVYMGVYMCVVLLPLAVAVRQLPEDALLGLFLSCSKDAVAASCDFITCAVTVHRPPFSHLVLLLAACRAVPPHTQT